MAISASAPRHSPQKKKGNYGFSGASLLPELLPTSWSMSPQFPAQWHQLGLSQARVTASLREEGSEAARRDLQGVINGEKKKPFMTFIRQTIQQAEGPHPTSDG